METYWEKMRDPLIALVDSKSRSAIRIDGNKKGRPKHSEMVKYLLDNYSETRNICEKNYKYTYRITN